MKIWTRSLSMSVLLAVAVAGSVGAQTPPSQTSAPSSNPPMAGKAEGAVMRVRGTVSAVDKENKTITLKGPRGRTLTFDVQDPTKLETVKVGDPVIGTYVEAVAIQLKPAGSTTPSASVTEAQAGSKPGDNPAGAIRREVTITGKIGDGDLCIGQGGADQRLNFIGCHCHELGLKLRPAGRGGLRQPWCPERCEFPARRCPRPR